MFHEVSRGNGRVSSSYFNTVHFTFNIPETWKRTGKNKGRMYEHRPEVK